MQDPHAPNGGGQAPEGRIITEEHLRHFINNARRHGVIDAVAGAGKSHQLEEALSMLPEEARVLLVAFNDKNAQEMKVIIRRRRRQDTCQASTFHKWAFRLLRCRNPGGEKVNVEEYKFKRFLGDRVLSGPGRWQRSKAAEDLANIAQNTNCGLGEAELERLREQYGLGLQLSPGEQRRVVRAVSAELNQLKTNIADMPVTAVDFNDMIWLPAISDDILLEIRFDWIFLDECQDFSPLQLLLLRRVLDANPKVRVLAAGDPHQSIYGFRGVQDSMPELRSILNRYGGVDEFTLPVCRRCPASHLRLARLVVPHIQPLPGREQGVLRHLPAAAWPGTLEEMAPGDYVLCRQVKPLVQLACNMVKEQRPARIVGEKSIKSALLAFFSDQRNATVDQVKQSMKDSHKTVKAELLAKGDTKQLGIYEQFYETALLLLEELESPQRVIEFLNDTFVSEAEPDVINCSTIHKIKGATKGKVWLLVGAPDTPDNHPPLALLEGEEQRILYVALTRSERELIIADCPFVKVDWPEVEKLIRGEDPSPTARAPIVSAATLPKEMFDLLHPQAPPALSHP